MKSDSVNMSIDKSGAAHTSGRKLTAVEAALRCKCPQCRTGDMFKYTVYNLANFNELHRECPHCGLRFQVEPGFYQGALYVSYAINITVMVILGVAIYILFDDPDLNAYLWGISPAIVILAPVTTRYSKVFFLYWFGGVKYREGLANTPPNQANS